MSGDFDDPQDLSLLVSLRTAGGALDPVPAEALAFARAAFSWRTVDEDLAGLLEVAELTGDSSLDDDRLVGVRSVTATGPRLLSFDGEDVALEVEVTPVGDRRRLIGQLVPPQPATIEIRHRGGLERVRADSAGRFECERVQAGPLSLRCRTEGPDRRVIDTPWTTV